MPLVLDYIINSFHINKFLKVSYMISKERSLKHHNVPIIQ